MVRDVSVRIVFFKFMVYIINSGVSKRRSIKFSAGLKLSQQVYLGIELSFFKWCVIYLFN